MGFRSWIGAWLGEPPLAFAFAPAGLLFPYYIGVAYELNSLGLLRRESPLGGASAGAIVATALACGVTEAQVRNALAALLRDMRRGVRLSAALRRQLEAVLNENAPAAARAHRLTVCCECRYAPGAPAQHMADAFASAHSPMAGGCFTSARTPNRQTSVARVPVADAELFPRPRRHIVTEWSSKQDLIDCVVASCNIPWYFDWPWPLVRCRNGWALDGFFAFPHRLGCPQLDAPRTIAISALPTRLPAVADADIIAPGRRGAALPAGVPKARWLRWALLPPSDDERITEMIELGKQHAQRWAKTAA